MGRCKPNHCQVCGKEILFGKHCTFCGRIAARIKRTKRARGFTEAQLTKCVKMCPSWKQFRAVPVKADSVGATPRAAIPVEYEQPDTLGHAGNAIPACVAAETAFFSIISPSGRRLEDNRVRGANARGAMTRTYEVLCNTVGCARKVRLSGCVTPSALPKEAQHPRINTPSGRAVYEKEGE